MSTISETISNANKLLRQAVGAMLSTVHAGDEKILSNQRAHTSPKVLDVSSPSFQHASPIDTKYTPQGENMSPGLAWSGVPEGTREIVIAVEDPDAPMLSPFVHWVLHGLPGSCRSLPEGLPATEGVPQVGSGVQAINDAKTRGWYGPKPPLGHGVHHYHFQVFALDAELNLGADASFKDVAKAMAGHVLADGEIIGTYERKSETD